MSATAGLLALLVLSTAGQFPRDEPRVNNFDELLPHNARDLARARFQASQADAGKLKQVKRDAAQIAFDFRYAECNAGRGTLDFLTETAVQLLEAQLALATTAGERFAALEKYWARMIEYEELNRSRYEAGRVDAKDYWGIRYYRLDAEVQLAEARAGDRTVPAWSAVVETQGDPDIFPTKQRARAKFAAINADPNALRIARRTDAGDIHIARLKNVYAGRGTLDFTLLWGRRWLDSQRTVDKQASDLFPFLQRYWQMTWDLEQLNLARYEVGRVGLADLAQSREWRLEAEHWLIDAAGRKPLTDTRFLPGLFGESWDEYYGSPLKKLSRAAFRFANSTPAALKRLRHEALRYHYAEREQNFLLGRGTLEFLIESANRLVEHEVATAADAGERRAALERHWKRTQQIEAVTRDRYHAGRVALQDWEQCRHERLAAELMLLQEEHGERK